MNESTDAMVLTRGTVFMEVDRCKGCELCIPVCRPGVLKMGTDLNDHGFPYPVLMPGCTACKACFEVCPDFVFEVYRFEEPQMIPRYSNGSTGGEA
ncbi:MAG: 4Fe-4S dicluster domain-containing protein [Acidimicrobiia bacterium]